MKIIELIFGSPQEIDSEEDPEPEEPGLKDIKKYLNNLDFETDYVKLEGPFLCADYAKKYYVLYKDFLLKTFYSVNCHVGRKFALVTSDATFTTHDNTRVRLGIIPATHRFEIILTEKDFNVVAVDNQLILNDNDNKKIKEVLKKFPLTDEEIYRNRWTIKH